MAFKKKTWKDRLVEYAGRRTIKRVSGDPNGTMVVDVTRNEGAVSQAGDAFSAENMNDLEQRIYNEFNALNTDFDKITTSDIIGYYNAYGDKNHHFGIKASTTSNISSTVIVYDDVDYHVPCALADNSKSEYRVIDICAYPGSSGWFLRVRFHHPTGVQTRYIPMQSSV